MLPIMLLLLSGVIEFGFMLNFYLDVIDAARETARFAANDDPIRDDTTGNPLDPNPNFYNRAQTLAKQSLEAAADGRIDWRTASCPDVNGDIVLSAFSVASGAVAQRYHSGAGETGVSMCGHYSSKLTTAEVNNIINGSNIGNTGFIVAEIYYEYDQTLGLPWITAFVPDPIILYAYSIMPNTNVEPTTTPLGTGGPPPPTNTSGPPLPTNTPGPSPTAGPTNTPTQTATNTATATATLAASCSDIYIDSMWISGDDIVADVVNNNAIAVTLTDTSFTWQELDPGSMYVDWFQFPGQYYNGDDFNSPTGVTGSSVALAGSSNATWRADFDGQPYDPIDGNYSLTLTFYVPGAGTCITSDSIAMPTLTPTPSPSCSDIYISSMWISGDDVIAPVVNDNLATGNLTTTNLTWSELSGSMAVNWFRLGGSQYYDGNDNSSPTTIGSSSVPLSGGSSADWRTDFSGEPYEPIDGSYALTLTFDFAGWGTCVISESIGGAATSTPTPSATPAPNCSDIYISNTWINGDDVRATVVNDNVAPATLTTTNFEWAELSGSMYVDYFRFDGSNYYNGNDNSSPTGMSGSSEALAGASSAQWEMDFDGEPYEPIDGTYSLTLTFDFPGWGTCVISDSVSG